MIAACITAALVAILLWDFGRRALAVRAQSIARTASDAERDRKVADLAEKVRVLEMSRAMGGR